MEKRQQRNHLLGSDKDNKTVLYHKYKKGDTCYVAMNLLIDHQGFSMVPVVNAPEHIKSTFSESNNHIIQFDVEGIQYVEAKENGFIYRVRARNEAQLMALLMEILGEDYKQKVETINDVVIAPRVIKASENIRTFIVDNLLVEEENDKELVDTLNKLFDEFFRSETKDFSDDEVQLIKTLLDVYQQIVQNVKNNSQPMQEIYMHDDIEKCSADFDGQNAKLI